MKFLFSVFALLALVAVFVSADNKESEPVVARYSVAARSAEPSLKCSDAACASQCRGIGWATGFCYKGDCCLEIDLSFENGPVVAQYSMVGGSAEPLLKCNNAACVRRCRRIRWVSGFCYKGNCWCVR
nr:unnamed protein product [Callosobruchus chinensis]